MAAIAHIDHLVVAARNLDEGVRWCESTLGVTPAAGGAHPLMGTHNRLLSVAGDAFPRCYLEVIAIDPQERPAREQHQRRWFDLDDALLQQGLAQGPRLIHFAVRVDDAAAVVQALATEPMHLDRGEVIAASRDTPNGRLEWKITVRDDGQRLFYGALPTLIEWGDVHPADSLPALGVTLTGLTLAHPRTLALRGALDVIGLDPLVMLTAGAPNIAATFDTPKGRVVLESHGL